MNKLNDREQAFNILNEQLCSLFQKHNVSNRVYTRLAQVARYCCTEEYAQVLLKEYVYMEPELRFEVHHLFEQYLMYLQSMD